MSVTAASIAAVRPPCSAARPAQTARYMGSFDAAIAFPTRRPGSRTSCSLLVKPATTGILLKPSGPARKAEEKFNALSGRKSLPVLSLAGIAAERILVRDIGSLRTGHCAYGAEFRGRPMRSKCAIQVCDPSECGVAIPSIAPSR